MTNSWTKWALRVLRPGHKTDRSLDAAATTIAEIESELEATAGVAGPFGHGTIRLRGHPAPFGAQLSAGALATEHSHQFAMSAVSPIWAGHGDIRLLEWPPR